MKFFTFILCNTSHTFSSDIHFNLCLFCVSTYFFLKFVHFLVKICLMAKEKLINVLQKTALSASASGPYQYNFPIFSSHNTSNLQQNSIIAGYGAIQINILNIQSFSLLVKLTKILPTLINFVMINSRIYRMGSVAIEIGGFEEERTRAFLVVIFFIFRCQLYDLGVAGGAWCLYYG